MENHKRPLVSVVTVTYNCEKRIARTIESVINQSYTNIEYIVIDGKSTDNTLSVIEKYRDKLDYVISEPDLGIFDAMNKGIAVANGLWINFMNAGDVFVHSGVLEEIVQSNHNDVGVIFGDKALLLKDGIYQIAARPFYKVGGTGMGINHQCVFVRTDLIKGSPFDLQFKVAADYKMIHSLYTMGIAFKYVAKPVALVESTGFSTRNKHRQMLEEERILGLPHRSVFVFYKESIKGKMKRMLLAALPVCIVRRINSHNPNIKKIDCKNGFCLVVGQ